MRYEYAEAQPEFQVPDPSIQDRSDLAGDIPADFPEDMSGAVDVTADYPEIAEDVDSGRAELQEAPEIAEDVGPYRAEMPEVPEIAEDVPGAEYPEYPWMNDTVQDSTPHFGADTGQPYFYEIPEDTISGAEIAAMLFPDAPEIPEDTNPEAEDELLARLNEDKPSPLHDTEGTKETAEQPVPIQGADTGGGSPDIPVNTAGSDTVSGHVVMVKTEQDRQAESGSNSDIPAREPDNTEKFAKIGEWPKAGDSMSIGDALSDANPNYDEGEEWQVNCQRCVPTYEMRRRGYDVSAMPCVEDMDHLALDPFDVWENPEIISCADDDQNVILDEMSQWEDGARAQVVVTWAGGEGGHTFIAEKVNGEIRFVDPQTGDIECSEYFDEIEPGTTQFCRIDNLQPSEHILDCCKEA